MKSCQTSIPSSSHEVVERLVLVDAVPATRSMLMPARRGAARASRAARVARTGSAGSTGVHTAPRANTGTPLTASASPSRSASSRGSAPARGTRPRRRRAHGCSPASTIRRTSCSDGSPCVCGHQADPAPELAARGERPVVARASARAGPVRRPAPVTSTRRADLARAAERPQRGATRQHAVVALEPRAQRAAPRRPGRGGARATPAATARPRPARARSPERGRAASCGRSAGSP